MPPRDSESNTDYATGSANSYTHNYPGGVTDPTCDTDRDSDRRAHGCSDPDSTNPNGIAVTRSFVRRVEEGHRSTKHRQR